MKLTLTLVVLALLTPMTSSAAEDSIWKFVGDESISSVDLEPGANPERAILKDLGLLDGQCRVSVHTPSTGRTVVEFPENEEDTYYQKGAWANFEFKCEDGKVLWSRWVG